MDSVFLGQIRMTQDNGKPDSGIALCLIWFFVGVSSEEHTKSQQSRKQPRNGSWNNLSLASAMYTFMKFEGQKFLESMTSFD